MIKKLSFGIYSTNEKPLLTCSYILWFFIEILQALENLYFAKMVKYLKFNVKLQYFPSI